VRPRIVLLAAALALVGCGDHRPEPVSAKAEGFPGYVVEADGHQVHFECRGDGSPTVVFLNGHPEEASAWDVVFDRSARVTRSCEYDRYGMGITGTYARIAPKARDAYDQERELDQLLANGRIPKPYVFVGHSWGGALGRLYAGTHDDVKAIVFVDSAVPGQEAAFRAAVPPKRAGESPLVTEQRNSRNGNPLDDPEDLDWEKSLSEAGTVTSLGDRPDVVITAGRTWYGDLGFETPVWMRLQNKLAALSSDSVHVFAPASSHFVQENAPDVVLAAIRGAVDAVRQDRRLAACAAIFGRLADARCPSAS
jgi:pimeloyl-ACP methyl ester carboxylesterase